MDIVKIARPILVLLESIGLPCKGSKKSDSVAIIKFEDTRIGTVIISDKDTSKEFKYKFNVRTDITESFHIKDDNVDRFYYSLDNTNEMIYDIINRAEQAKKWTNLPPWEVKKDSKLSTKNI